MLTCQIHEEEIKTIGNHEELDEIIELLSLSLKKIEFLIPSCEFYSDELEEMFALIADALCIGENISYEEDEE